MMASFDDAGSEEISDLFVGRLPVMGKVGDRCPAIDRFYSGILCCFNSNWLTLDLVASLKFFFENV